MAVTRVVRVEPATAPAIPAIGVPVPRIRPRAARPLRQAARTEAVRRVARPVSVAVAGPLRVAGERRTVPLGRVGSPRHRGDRHPSVRSPEASLAPAVAPTNIRPRQPAALDQVTRREIHGGTVISSGAAYTFRLTAVVAGRFAVAVAERLPAVRSEGGAAEATLSCRGIASPQAVARCGAECVQNRGGR